MNIVWPSELYFPYQFDLSNPDLSNITSCTYDDGTAVYDLVNGGTTAFDVVNQIGITAPGGQRISATWSTANPANIDDNPFSLLLTQYEKLTNDVTAESFDVNGGNNDYSDIVAWGNARKNSATHEIANNYGIQYLTSDFDQRTTFLQNFTVRGATGEFKGDFEDSNIAVITRDPSYTSWLFDDRTQRGNYENIIIDAGDGYVFYSYYKGANFKRVGIKCGHSYGLYTTSLVEQTLIECVIENPNSHALYVLAGKTNFVDSIARGNASSYGQLRIRGGSTSLHIVNSLVESQNPSSKAIATQYGAVVTGGNTVTNDDSAVTFGVGAEDANLSTYFDSNGQINETGQVALKGSGWNGSDVASFAYVESLQNQSYLLEPVHIEQIDTVDVVELSSNAILNSINVEQTDEIEIVSVFTSSLLTAINVEQIDTVSTIELSLEQPANYALDIVYIEQIDEIQAVALNQTNLLSVVHTEQTDTVTVIDLSSTSANRYELQTVNVEQVDTVSTIDFAQQQQLETINVEQIDEVTISYLSTSNMNAQFNLDASHITIISTTPIYELKVTTPHFSVVSTTPIYTILES